MPKQRLDKTFLAEFGKKIKILREVHGMTQEELAEKIERSVAFVSRVENGQKGMGRETVRQLSELFKIHPSYFYIEEQIPDEHVDMIVNFFKMLKKDSSKNMNAIKHLLKLESE